MAGCISPLAQNALRTCTTRRVRLFHPSSRHWLIHNLDWARLKGYIGIPSENFPNLSRNVVEKPLFKTLLEADYDTLFHELFAHRGEHSKDWTKQDWICIDCIREFFRVSVFRWWREQKVQGNILILVCSRRRGLTVHQPASQSHKIAGIFIIPACRRGPC